MKINKKSRIISIILQWTITVMYSQKYINDKQGQWQEYCHIIPWIVSCLKIQKITLGPEINPLFWCLFTRNQPCNTSPVRSDVRGNLEYCSQFSQTATSDLWKFAISPQKRFHSTLINSILISWILHLGDCGCSSSYHE